MRPEAVDYLRAGLKAASLRQTVIANNIANLHTPGFRRSEVRFESLLADALKTDSSAEPSAVAPQVVRPMQDETDGQGNDVSLDVEVGEMVKNTAAFKTYFRILGKLMKQLDMAIQG